MLKNNLYPFTAVVGQDEAKKALLIALVNRSKAFLASSCPTTAVKG